MKRKCENQMRTIVTTIGATIEAIKAAISDDRWGRPRGLPLGRLFVAAEAYVRCRIVI